MKTLTILICAAVFLLSSAVATAGGYIKFDGVDGESKDRNHEGWSDLLSMSWQMTNRVDRASGLPTGKRQHKPVSITKPVDKSSPLLMNLISGGEINDAVEMHLTRFNSDGTTQVYLIIKLEKARVSSYSIVDGARNEEGNFMPTHENISLTYDKITWTYVEGSVEHTDDWQATR